MAVKLNKKELEHIKNFKYETNPATPLDKVYDPFWTGCITIMPRVS